MRVYLGGDPGGWRQDLASALEAYQVVVDADTAAWPVEAKKQAIRASDLVVVCLGSSPDGPIEAHYAAGWRRPVIGIAASPPPPWLASCLYARAASPPEVVPIVVDRFLVDYDPAGLVR